MSVFFIFRSLLLGKLHITIFKRFWKKLRILPKSFTNLQTKISEPDPDQHQHNKWDPDLYKIIPNLPHEYTDMIHYTVVYTIQYSGRTKNSAQKSMECSCLHTILKLK